MIVRLLNDIKFEEVVILQSQYETSRPIQYNHFLVNDCSHTCLSRNPHVCDLWEPGYRNLQYGGDDEDQLG